MVFRRILAALFSSFLISQAAVAQISSGPGGTSYSPGVAQSGSVTVGNCAQWAANGKISDAGAACGSGGSGTVTSSGSPVSGNIAKFTTSTNIAPASASNIVSLFSTCSGTQYLGADGACHTASGSGTVTSITPAVGITNTPGSAGTAITTTGSLYTQSIVNTYTGNHTVTSAESAGVDVFKPANGTDTGTFTLPQAGTTGFESGTSYEFLNTSSGNLTLTTTTSVFIGVPLTSTNIVMAQYGSVTCTSDGTNWNCALNSVSSGGSGDTITSPNSTLSVGGTSTNTTLDINLANANTWTKSQKVTPATVSISTATFTPDLSASNNHNITLVHASCPCTLANPTNIVAGQSGVIVVNQSATGSDLINTYGSDYIFTNSAAPTLSTAASAVDELSYYVVDSTHIRISPLTSTAATPLTANTGTPTCGTGCSSITAGSTNARGSMVTGSSISAATVNWSGTLSYTPICTISDSNTTAVSDISSISTSALTTSFASALTSVTVYWICVQ